MAFNELPPDVRAIAEEVLTPKQLDVFKLWANGNSTLRISLIVDVSETRARVILQRAQQKVRIAMERAA